MKKQSGFTLVELSIVMVIVGLLIGGILKGQELVNNAKIKGVYNQMEAYLAAMHTFQDKYGQLPGDMINPINRIPGCTAANFCSGGNGNGRIGGEVFANWNADQLGAGIPQSETTQFWKHLALADLIIGVNGAANPAMYAWGATHPASKVGGGFTALYLPDSGLVVPPAPTNVNAGFNGNMIRLQAALGVPLTGPMTESNLAKIDIKYDDGASQSGRIQGERDCDIQYDEISQSFNCIVFFILR